MHIDILLLYNKITCVYVRQILQILALNSCCLYIVR